MGEIDEALAELKKRKDRHYRLVALNPGNVTVKKFRGYEPVKSTDPEVEGTILAKERGPDGMIKIGNLGLMSCPKEKYEEHQKRIQEKNQARIDLIKRQYKQSEEVVKRKLGKAHKHYEHFTKVEEE